MRVSKVVSHYRIIISQQLVCWRLLIPAQRWSLQTSDAECSATPDTMLRLRRVPSACVSASKCSPAKQHHQHTALFQDCIIAFVDSETFTRTSHTHLLCFLLMWLDNKFGRVCVCLCLSVRFGFNFWKLWPAKFISGRQLHLQLI